MIEDIKLHIKRLPEEKIDSLENLENFRIKYLSKKGLLNQWFGAFKQIPNEQKREYGQVLNEAKQSFETFYISHKKQLENGQLETGINDVTRPAAPVRQGGIHPLTMVKNEIVDIFARIGYSVSEGPEIEDDWHNFSALNFPEEHPARDMQDTFFVAKNPDWALRTHTSSVQVRVMENSQPPIRTISPGRVYRNKAISARAHCMFHQVEGLYIDKNVSFADLKQTLLYFAESFFGKGTKIRMRPSYFPFTEPSAEVDIWWGLENEVDHRITKGTGWLEILGAGMVDPEVLKNCNIDPDVYSGFAFGMGIERIAMNRFGIPDLRLYFENDLRFLSQFKA